MVGMLVAAVSAAVASFTGLRGLALLSGWPERLALLLPITIDAYATTSARVWLVGTSPRRAVRFARANAIGAISASIIGNAIYHAASVGLIAVTWPIVVAVGAVPAAVLGLTAHLHAVRSVPDRTRVRPRPNPNPPRSVPMTSCSPPLVRRTPGIAPSTASRSLAMPYGRRCVSPVLVRPRCDGGSPRNPNGRRSDD
jgi:hypothetical protein